MSRRFNLSYYLLLLCFACSGSVEKIAGDDADANSDSAAGGGAATGGADGASSGGATSSGGTTVVPATGGGLLPSTGGAGSEGGAGSGGSPGGGGAFPLGGASPADGGSLQGMGGAAEVTECDRLRSDALDFYHSLLPAASACSTDQECTYATFSNACGVVCPNAVSGPNLHILGSGFSDYGTDYCAELQCVQQYPTACPPPPSAFACVEGHCQYTVEYVAAGQYSSP